MATIILGDALHAAALVETAASLWCHFEDVLRDVCDAIDDVGNAAFIGYLLGAGRAAFLSLWL